MSNNYLPYFDFLISELQKKETIVEKGFGKHVHWGYWPNPLQAQYTHDDYYWAAKNLSTKICDISQIKDNQTVLDVGCGFGGTIAELNEQYSGMTLIGLNIDRRQLERAVQLVQPARNNQINFVEGNACSLSFEDNQFDNILAIECIFHFPSRKTFLEQACRALKPGGRITLSDLIPSPLFLPQCMMLNLPLINKFNFFGACNINYTLHRYIRLASKLGLEIEIYDITRNVLPTYYYLDFLLKNVRLTQPYRSMAAAFTMGMRFLSKTSLLKYQILSFKKPDIDKGCC